MDLNPPQVPFVSVGGDFENAKLRIVTPEVPDPEIPLRFNPTSYQLQKANEFAEIAIPGLETAPIQYVRGGSETLSFDALLDTSDTLDNVRETYVDKLANLMKINSELHAPPIVHFEWESSLFQGVVSNMSATYVLFSPDGVPLRAEVSLQLTAYRPVEIQLNERPRNSPDVAKSVPVRRGDRLDQIASGLYQDPAQWREIARRNGISDPRRIEPGSLLLAPSLQKRGGGR